MSVITRAIARSNLLYNQEIASSGFTLLAMTNGVSMPESVIDSSTFNSLKEVGDADFINELIDTFLEEAPRMLMELRQALADKNAELFRRSAHSLKSNGNTFGALRLASLAKELEFIGRDNQLDTVGDRLEKLSTEYAMVEYELKGLRNA